jgi:hypothetical protein
MTDQDKLYKIDNNNIKLVSDKDKTIEITDPEYWKVYFLVFTVKVAEKTVPERAVEIGGVPVGVLFVIPDAYIPKRISEALRSPIIPYNTQFVKINKSQFIQYKAGKYNPEDYGLNLAEISKDRPIDEPIAQEELIQITMDKKPVKKTDKIYDIVDGLDVGYQSWETRQLSPAMRVVIQNELDIAPKKVSTLDNLFEALFKKYDVKKDDMGEYIIIPQSYLEAELGKVHIELTEFDKLTRNETVQLPTGRFKRKPNEEDEKVPKMEKYNTRIGNTSKYYWVLDIEGNWLINRGSSK